MRQIIAGETSILFDQRHRSGDQRADRRAEYAAHYARAGDPDAAMELMEQALELAPGWLLGQLKLGEYMEAAGHRDAAALIYARLLAGDIADPYGAGLKLAALGVAPVPQSPPQAFVTTLFDQYADSFEDSLVNRLLYAVPDAIRDLLALQPGTSLPAVLDLGCGTGLMGERLRPHADHLAGIDLSPGMLAKARRKRLYDALFTGDIRNPPGAVASRAYDLVTAADVFIYLGDLDAVMAEARSLVRPGGTLAFSTETVSDGGYRLQPSLRYAHSQTYVAAVASAHGFDIAVAQAMVIRRDQGADVAGHVYLCIRR